MFVKNFKFIRTKIFFRKPLSIVFICFFLFFSENANATVNSDSMLGYWKFDGNCSDYSGHGSTGLINGSAVYGTNGASTDFSNANSISFLNSSSYISFANQFGLQPPSALTLSLWINLGSYPSAISYIAGNYDIAYQNRGFYFRLDSAYLSFIWGNGSTQTTTYFPITSIPLNSWTLLTATWDGSNARLYRNGTEISSATTSGSISYSGTVFYAGNFEGDMDDLRLYDRALSDFEIQELANGTHTSANWTGTGNYENPVNWNINAIPDPYTRVTISSGQANFSAGESMARLQVESGALLDLLNYDLTLNDSGDFLINGSLSLDNSQTLTGITTVTGDGTVVYNNASAVSIFALGNTYNNLILNGDVNLSFSLAVNGDLILNAGSLNANGHDIYVGRRWEKINGNFIHGNGTVILDGMNQTILGSNTFYNLTKNSTASDNLYLAAGETQAIANTLTLYGISSISPLNLRSTASGTQWEIDPQGTVNLNYLDIQDSYNIGTAISASGLSLIDSGGNTNWVFTEYSAPPTSESSGDDDESSDDEDDEENDDSSSSSSATSPIASSYTYSTDIYNTESSFSDSTDPYLFSLETEEGSESSDGFSDEEINQK